MRINYLLLPFIISLAEAFPNLNKTQPQLWLLFIATIRHLSASKTVFTGALGLEDHSPCFHSVKQVEGDWVFLGFIQAMFTEEGNYFLIWIYAKLVFVHFWHQILETKLIFKIPLNVHRLYIYITLIVHCMKLS